MNTNNKNDLQLSELQQICVGLTQAHLTPITLNGRQTFVHQSMVAQLKALNDAAMHAGFHFTIASGFRDYHAQANIISAKFMGKRPILDSHSQPLDPLTLNDDEKLRAILRWSALPGASRHHWGSELDVYASNMLPNGTSLKLEPWEYQTGHQQEFADWLHQNMAQFGFFLPYAQDLGGVAVEPWHISYAPVGHTLQQNLTTDLLLHVWHHHPFMGQFVAEKIIGEIYQQYIVNISDAPSHLV